MHFMKTRSINALISDEDDEGRMISTIHQYKSLLVFEFGVGYIDLRNPKSQCALITLLIAISSFMREQYFIPVWSLSMVLGIIMYNSSITTMVGMHGIIIELSDPGYNTRRSATCLPNIAAQEGFLGWTKIENNDYLMHKAGYGGTITESVRHIQLTHDQSTLFTIRYVNYVSNVKTAQVLPLCCWPQISLAYFIYLLLEPQMYLVPR